VKRCLGALFLLLACCACVRWGKDTTQWNGSTTSDSDGSQAVIFTPPVDVPAEVTQEYRIAHGDLLVIDDAEHPDARRDGVLVDNDGTVSFLMLNGIPAAGKTFAELSVDIAQRISLFHRNPSITVALAADGSRGHRLYIFGQVKRAGEIPYDRPLRILDVIAAAGGFELEVRSSRMVQSVDLAHSVLLRHSEVIPIDFTALIEQGDLRYNIQMHPGDMLMISSLLDEVIYVMGAVNRAGEQHYLANLGLLGAIARAGGLHERAKRSQVAVVRGNLGRPRVILVDVDELLTARHPDVLLHPGDLVYVSDRPTQYARELALAAIRTFVAILGTRAGIDAVNKN
jgi:polysaccharide biosynthesis/export protein